MRLVAPLVKKKLAFAFRTPKCRRQLLQSGDYTSYGFGLRRVTVNECNGDVSPTTNSVQLPRCRRSSGFWRSSCCKPRRSTRDYKRWKDGFDRVKRERRQKAEVPKPKIVSADTPFFSKTLNLQRWTAWIADSSHPSPPTRKNPEVSKASIPSECPSSTTSP